MEFSQSTTVKYVRLKSTSQQCEVEYREVKTAYDIRFDCSTESDFLLTGLRSAGNGVVCFLGYLMRKIFGESCSIFASNCIIFQTVISDKKEHQFDAFVTKDLTSELNRKFAKADSILKKELGDKLSKVDEKVLEILKSIKISSAEVCDVEEVRQAKEKSKMPSPPAPPTNLRVVENIKSPSTSVLVFYERPTNEDIVEYIVTAEKPGAQDEEPVTKISKNEYALLLGLERGQLYVIWVQSVRNGAVSSKCVLKEPIRTATYDPFPWRSKLSDFPVLYKRESRFEYSKENISNAGPGRKRAKMDGGAKDQLEEMRNELSHVLGMTPRDSKMDDLMHVFSSTGIAQAQDLKYLGYKEVVDELKKSMKIVQVLKLVDYAKDQYSAQTGNSEEGREDQGAKNSLTYNVQRQEIQFHQGGRFSLASGLRH